ncbi:MAG: hypothetical protein AABX70_02885 [Nanoarchaeota archaeon]
MNTRASVATTRFLVYTVLGCLLGGLFVYHGVRVVNSHLIKTDLYAKDTTLLADSLRSLPTDTDVSLTYPYDFSGYTLTQEKGVSTVQYKSQKETTQGKADYSENKNYLSTSITQQEKIRYLKLQGKINPPIPSEAS